MNKDDLRPGMVVELRKGDLCFVCGHRDIFKFYLIKIINGSYIASEDDYDCDLSASHTPDTKLDIMKVYKEYTCKELLWERKEEILDKKEKEYLSAVIKPFRNRFNGIVKRNLNSIKQYITIFVDVDDWFTLPAFDKDTMYKGIKVDKKYTLEKLGL